MFTGPRGENVKEEHVSTNDEISSDDSLVNKTKKQAGDNIALLYSTLHCSTLHCSTRLYTALLDSKTALVSIIFILELSVLDKSCLELNFQTS